jgi:hypothetical protein
MTGKEKFEALLPELEESLLTPHESHWMLTHIWPIVKIAGKWSSCIETQDGRYCALIRCGKAVMYNDEQDAQVRLAISDIWSFIENQLLDFLVTLNHKNPTVTLVADCDWEKYKHNTDLYLPMASLPKGKTIRVDRNLLEIFVAPVAIEIGADRAGFMAGVLFKEIGSNDIYPKKTNTETKTK